MIRLEYGFVRLSHTEKHFWATVSVYLPAVSIIAQCWSNCNINFIPQGASVSGRIQMVDALLCHQLHPFPPPLLPHHPSHYNFHHGQVQCYQTSGVPKCERIMFSYCCFGERLVVSPGIFFMTIHFYIQKFNISLFCSTESNYHPVLSHSPTVVLLCPTSYHCLLLCLLWSPLDPVWFNLTAVNNWIMHLITTLSLLAFGV